VAELSEIWKIIFGFRWVPRSNVVMKLCAFLGGLERPDVDKIDGLSPVIAIEQKTY
jgi:hypothetical protein